MADLAMQKRKKAITQERKSFSEICKLKTSEDLDGKFNLLHAHRRLALEW